MVKLFLQIFTDPNIFDEKLRIILLGIPSGIPGLDAVPTENLLDVLSVPRFVLPYAPMSTCPPNKFSSRWGFSALR